MSQSIEIIFYGSLRDRRAGVNATADDLFPLSEATSLAALIDRLEVEREAIQLAMLNHRAVSAEEMVRPGDRLALFPKEYPIFIDWNDYRL